MPRSHRVIITCAITGSSHTPVMSPHLPLTPERIASEAIAAAEAGAAIVHLHARDPLDGRPTYDPAVFGQFLPRIKRCSNVIVNMTTGGGRGMTVDQRLEAPLKFKPELASLNMGSLAPVGSRRVLKRFEGKWKYQWEQEHVASGFSIVPDNSEQTIEHIIVALGQGCGTRFECECHDIGNLYNVAYFLEEGLLKPPVLVQTLFGMAGGMGTDVENLFHVRRIADKLFGDEYYWSILAPGRHQLTFCTIGAALGSNVRVGLEDNLYVAKGQIAESNAQQVTRIRQILELLSLEIATPDEVREMLSLKGADQVAF